MVCWCAQQRPKFQGLLVYLERLGRIVGSRGKTIIPLIISGRVTIRVTVWELGRYSLGVCIVFFERLDQTLECLRSFLPSNVPVYVLNNGSSRFSTETFASFCSEYEQLKVYDFEVNLGVNVGKNKLIAQAEEKWLLFVDNDIVVKTPDWFTKFQSHVAEHEDAEVFVPRLFNVHEDRYVVPLSLRMKGKFVRYVVGPVGDFYNYAPGTAFYRRTLFDRLGLYDEKMFDGGTDFEFSLRNTIQQANESPADR